MIDFPEDLTLHSLTESKRYSLYGVVVSGHLRVTTTCITRV